MQNGCLTLQTMEVMIGTAAGAGQGPNLGKSPWLNAVEGPAGRVSAVQPIDFGSGFASPRAHRRFVQCPRPCWRVAVAEMGADGKVRCLR